MTDHRKREHREVSGDLSRKLSNNARKNQGSPWRTRPLVPKAQNYNRLKNWRDECDS